MRNKTVLFDGESIPAATEGFHEHAWRMIAEEPDIDDPLSGFASWKDDRECVKQILSQYRGYRGPQLTAAEQNELIYEKKRCAAQAVFRSFRM